MPAYPDRPTDGISSALTAMPTGTAVSALAKRLLDLFTTGDIPAGTRLPPERELASTLGIGRSAVREALAALEILGVVDVRPGSGTYLRGSASELLPETLSWGLMIGAPRTRELIEVRAELEVMAARLAATKATDADLAKLSGYLDSMREHVGTPTRFIEADLKFHLHIARLADNQVLLDLLQSIRSLLRVWVERGLRRDDDAEYALREHTLIFDALANRDPAAVEHAMREHMTTASARLELSTADTGDAGGADDVAVAADATTAGQK